MTFRFLAAALACCCASHAAAILIRPDRDDTEYLELATRYTSSVSLDAPDGEGVLIAARWLLTAAPVARSMQERRVRGDIQAYFFQGDIALLLLRAPMRGAQPSLLYRRDDEAGKGLVTVGAGATGKIGDKVPPRPDGKRRAAINTVHEADARVLIARIKPADEASDLQGALAPGDRGAPAYIENDEGIFVAGIALGSEGGRERYARVSAYVPWIEATMVGVARRELDQMLGEDDRG